jgi:hypothetical protein
MSSSKGRGCLRILHGDFLIDRGSEERQISVFRTVAKENICLTVDLSLAVRFTTTKMLSSKDCS